LCSGYWYPLYAFARRRGLDHHAAQDAVQGFFARLIEKDDLKAADPTRGRFRSFLLAGFSSFLANAWDQERGRKRGGSFARLSIDEAAAEKRFAAELSVAGSPERRFEREWAREVLARSLAALEAEWDRAGGASSSSGSSRT
jgi:RNA polymerase sigma-70 factor (ECF subfamily)